MVPITLGRVLKSCGIKQIEVVDKLSSLYGCDICLSQFNGMCREEYPRQTDKWDTVQACLEEQYGIGHRNGMWQRI